MRYIDTGTRAAEHTVGAWLVENLLQDDLVAELRWQTGFFSADSLGYFARLKDFAGLVRGLIGSNEGLTRRADIEKLLAIFGNSRENIQIGVLKFDTGYFHPKNLTQKGFASRWIA